MRTKSLSFLLSICMILALFAGCTAPNTSPTGTVEESIPEFSKEEIYNEFLEADKMYYNWFEQPIYYDVPEDYDHYNWPPCPIKHDTIKTPEDLEQEMRKHFNDRMVSVFMQRLNPKMKDEKMYVNFGYNMGDSGEIISHKFIQNSPAEFILTITVDYSASSGENVDYQILCEYHDRNWVFSNYIEDIDEYNEIVNSEYADDYGIYYFSECVGPYANAPYPTKEEAMEIAKEFWDWEPYRENGELVTQKSTTITPGQDKNESFYTMYLRWWVDDHWSTIDYLYINKITGKCTQENVDTLDWSDDVYSVDDKSDTETPDIPFNETHDVEKTDKPNDITIPEESKKELDEIPVVEYYEVTRKDSEVGTVDTSEGFDGSETTVFLPVSAEMEPYQENITAYYLEEDGTLTDLESQLVSIDDTSYLEVKTNREGIHLIAGNHNRDKALVKILLVVVVILLLAILAIILWIMNAQKKQKKRVMQMLNDHPNQLRDFQG